MTETYERYEMVFRGGKAKRFIVAAKLRKAGIEVHEGSDQHGGYVAVFERKRDADAAAHVCAYRIENGFVCDCGRTLSQLVETLPEGTTHLINSDGTIGNGLDKPDRDHSYCKPGPEVMCPTCGEMRRSYFESQDGKVEVHVCAHCSRIISERTLTE